MSFSTTELITIYPRSCSPYTKEGKKNFLPQEGKKKISRLLNSNKLYVSFILMYE